MLILACVVFYMYRHFRSAYTTSDPKLPSAVASLEDPKQLKETPQTEQPIISADIVSEAKTDTVVAKKKKKKKKPVLPNGRNEERLQE